MQPLWKTSLPNATCLCLFFVLGFVLFFLEVTVLYHRKNSGTGVRTSEGLIFKTSSAAADWLGDFGGIT